MKTIKAKSVSVYGLFIALAMMLSYVEALFPLDFIAPGIKVGLANLVPLYLILVNRPKGAFSVNVLRILLTAVIFGNVFSLLFSFTAGVISTVAMLLLNRSVKFGVVGISAVAGALHNITQIAIALLTVGKGVMFYLPLLTVAGLVTGIIIGIVAFWLLKNKALKRFFVKI